jgi:hypothetical protein
MSSFTSSSSSSSSAFLALKPIVIDCSEISSELFIWVGYGGESIPSYRLNLLDYLSSSSLVHYLKDGFLPSEDESRVWNSLYLGFIQLFHEIFVNLLRVKPKQCKVVIVENLFMRKILRDCIFSVLSNPMNVGAITFQPNLSLLPLSIGKSSGMIIFVGEKESQIIAFSHFHVLLKSLKMSCGYDTCLQELKKLILTDLLSVTEETEKETMFNILNDLLAASALSKSITSEVVSYAATKHGINERTMKVSSHFSSNDVENCLYSCYCGVGKEGKGLRFDFVYCLL